jgi:hypothetical protein
MSVNSRAGRLSVVSRSLILAGLMLLLLPAGSAWAGKVWATGHDADYHCNGGSASSTTNQCHYVLTAVNYVRSGAPDPTKKVLALDNLGLRLDSSLTSLGIPHDTVDPRSAAFGTTPFSTDTYSAIAVASDYTCGGCDLNHPPGTTTDSDAINARAGDFTAFFNAGGGVLALAGADHGGGSGANVYYNFMPLPVGGVAVSPPFCLTAPGAALGLEDQRCPDAAKRTGTHDDINPYATHNSFNNPDPSGAVKVAETDAENFAETLFADGVIVGGKIVAAAAVTPAAPAPPLPLSLPPPKPVVPSKASISVRGVRTTCVSTSFSPTISIRAPAGVKNITVSVDGRRVQTSKKSRFTLAISVRKLKAGRHSLSVVAVDSRNRTTTQHRSFFRCAQKAAAKPRPVFTG